MARQSTEVVSASTLLVFLVVCVTSIPKTIPLPATPPAEVFYAIVFFKSNEISGYSFWVTREKCRNLDDGANMVALSSERRWHVMTAMTRYKDLSIHTVLLYCLSFYTLTLIPLTHCSLYLPDSADKHAVIKRTLTEGSRLELKNRCRIRVV